MENKLTVSIKIKWLLLFLIATLSLLLSGNVANHNFNIDQIIVIIIGGFCGVFLIYDVNLIDSNASFGNKLKQFMRYKRKVFLAILLISLIPFAYIVLSRLSFVLFSITGIVAVLYSLTIEISNKRFRLKNIFFFKNFLIGICWGAMVVIGAGSIENDFIIYMALLAFVQVFLGSVIRDISDVETDSALGVKSFPVVFGVSTTFVIMHLINLFSFAILFYSKCSVDLVVLIAIIVAWRFFNLVMLQKSKHSSLWLQTINLLTCCLFLVVVLIQHVYGLY